MTVTQQKISTTELIPGMYVAKLDRPWIETPFPLQGFQVRTPKQVETLKQYCNYVFIDVELGVAPRASATHAVAPLARRSVVKARSGKTYRLEKPAVLKFKPVQYKKTSEIKREVAHATKLHGEVTRLMTQVHNKVRSNGEFKYSYIKAASKAVSSSLVRNPDAMMWLTRVRDVDSYSYDHSIRSAVLAGVFGRHLGLPREELEKLIQGCLLADIGKTRVPRAILQKRGKLTDDERRVMEEHVLHGWEILSKIPEVSPEVLAIVQLHHERYDGKGYPFGLRGAEIPLLVQIASLVDVYDAITSPRPYSGQLPTTDAVSVMYEQRGQQFQEQLVEHFIQAIGIYPSGTLVELNNGEVGIVIEQNKSRRLKPVVMVLLSKLHEKLSKPKVLDLMKLEEQTASPVKVARSLSPGTYNLYPGEIRIDGRMNYAEMIY